MPSKLTEMFEQTTGELLIKQASGILGESKENTAAAVRLVIPSLLGALIQKGNSDSGASDLMDYLAEANIDGSVLSNAEALLGGGIETEKLMYSGAGIIRYLLDDKLSPIANVISGSSGVTISSATSLIKLAAPLLTGTLGKFIREKGLDASGVKTFLAGEKEFVISGISPEMTNKLGLGFLSAKGDTLNQELSRGTLSGAGRTTLSGILPWLVLALAALGMFYFVQKGCGSGAVIPEEIAEAIPVDTVSVALVPDTKTADPLKSYALPGGVTLKILPGSCTGQMAEFLAGNESGNKCFVFDMVGFQNGTSILTKGSDAQLIQLAELLKAYPDVKASIEAYTDDVGDDGKNKSLTKQRAREIKDWLTSHSIAAGRIDTKGYGEENPVATNKTETGRKLNNRVEVCVKRK